MKNIDPNYLHYIQPHKMESKFDILARMCDQRKVLHIGCADHVDLISEKISNGTHLHSFLNNHTSELHGLDINLDGVEKLKQAGFNNIYTSADNIKTNFDIVLIPDVIEHILDCNSFLEDVASIPSKKYIFTTPNAYRLENRFLFKYEAINTDHRYWHSPFTISNLIESSKFKIDEILLYDVARKRFPIKTMIKKNFPLTRGGILITATLTNLK